MRQSVPFVAMYCTDMSRSYFSVFSGLWGLINNAGICTFLPFELQEVALYEKMISTNLIGAIDVAMTFLPLIKRERGRILNVSSYSGRIALPVVTSYAVSKHALEAFTDGLRWASPNFIENY